VGVNLLKNELKLQGIWTYTLRGTWQWKCLCWDSNLSHQMKSRCEETAWKFRSYILQNRDEWILAQFVDSEFAETNWQVQQQRQIHKHLLPPKLLYRSIGPVSRYTSNILTKLSSISKVTWLHPCFKALWC